MNNVSIHTHSFIVLTLLSIPSSLFAGLPEGTLVLTPHGKIPIESLQPEDTVKSYDPISRALVDTKVRIILKHKSKKIVLITTDKETITATSNHPFYIANNNAYKNAETLKQGDVLLCVDGTTCSCREVQPFTISRMVYDLCLEHPHTFFVGEHSLFTHNIAEFITTFLWSADVCSSCNTVCKLVKTATYCAEKSQKELNAALAILLEVEGPSTDNVDTTQSIADEIEQQASESIIPALIRLNELVRTAANPLQKDESFLEEEPLPSADNQGQLVSPPLSQPRHVTFIHP